MKKLLAVFIFAVTILFIPRAADAQSIITDEKLITIDLGNQMIYAWDDGRIQYSSVVSTGMRYTPTVTGHFAVRTKVPIQDMRGYFPPYEPYYTKDVRHVMYFYGAYAIHGAHWHNNFGTRVSHGCVNLPPAAAEWMYNWAEIGTPVVVF